MSKWYEVTMQCVKTVVIEMEEPSSLEDVGNTALGETFFGYDNKEVVECCPLESDEAVEQHKRHAEEVFSL